MTWIASNSFCSFSSFNDFDSFKGFNGFNSSFNSFNTSTAPTASTTFNRFNRFNQLQELHNSSARDISRVNVNPRMTPSFLQQPDQKCFVSSAKKKRRPTPPSL
jgi:hypothetical protein